MKRIHTQIDIDAPAEKVWDILLDFDRYPDWNPFILEASGQVIPDQKLRVTIKAPAMKAMTFKPRVVAAEDGRRLCWLGRLGIPGLFDGQHCFELEPLGQDKVRFTHSERISGLLTYFTAETIARTRQGFEFMNESLKRRAEGDVT